jgi:hypothetical protein
MIAAAEVKNLGGCCFDQKSFGRLLCRSLSANPDGENETMGIG